MKEEVLEKEEETMEQERKTEENALQEEKEETVKDNSEDKKEIVKDNNENKDNEAKSYKEKEKENFVEVEQQKEEEKAKSEVSKHNAKFEEVADSKTRKIEKQKMQVKNKKRKIIATAVIITIILIFAIAISTVFSLFTLTNENIMSGVSIEGIEMSGLTKQEAKEKLELLYNEKKEKEISASYEDYETILSPTVMEVNYEIEKAVNEAYIIGRKENIFVSNYDVIFTLICKKNIEVEMKLNEEVTKQTIDAITVNLPGVVLESSYYVEDDELIVSKGKPGIGVDTEDMISKVKAKLKDIKDNENHIEIPVVSKEPEPIDIEKIHEEICREAQDAYYTKEPFTVYPEVEGISFDLEEAKAILAEEKEEYIIKLTITKPNITLSQIGDEAFPNQLGTCTTRYDVSDSGRSTNLAVACQKLNGKVIMPGETFSYNKTLGERTVAAGYRTGKMYVAGEVVDGIGGGICQISSTLYNAVLKADLEIVERRNHQFTCSYIEAGKDATVAYGLIDFRFKNTRKYPVKLVASAKAGIATVSVYGLKEETEYTIEIKSKVLSTFPPTTKYVEDDTLDAGTEKVKQKGSNGMKTETYITKYLNGKAVSTTLISRDTYDAMQKIVLKGTKGTTSPTSDGSTQSTTPETPTTQETPQTPTETPTEAPGGNGEGQGEQNPATEGEGTDNVNP